MIKKYVAKKIATLQSGSPESKAILARLRRGLGKDLSESEESWGFIYLDLPESLSYEGSGISEAERAIHLALTLFAMHQQGSDRSAHIKDVSFGQAMSGIITKDRGNEDAVIRRFNSLITSDDITELSTHLRNMIQLMKASDRFIGFDYEIFTKDLYYYQFSEGKKNVKITWGKQFYRQKKGNTTTEGSE